MKRNTQQGFTLIELIMVIVILGILAATALPKFVDLSGDAHKASANAVLGAANSAAAMNYGKTLLDSSNAKIISGATLIARLDLDSAWTADDSATPKNINATLGGTSYIIGISTIESSTTKAAFSKSW